MKKAFLLTAVVLCSCLIFLNVSFSMNGNKVEQVNLSVKTQTVSAQLIGSYDWCYYAIYVGDCICDNGFYSCAGYCIAQHNQYPCLGAIVE